MDLKTNQLLVIMTDVAEGHQTELDEWYDKHAAHLVELDGIGSAARYRSRDLPELSGITLGASNMVIYTLKDPDVLESKEWAEANSGGPFAHMQNLLRNRYMHVRTYE